MWSTTYRPLRITASRVAGDSENGALRVGVAKPRGDPGGVILERRPIGSCGIPFGRVELYRSHAPLDTDKVLPNGARLIIPESTWTDSRRSAELWEGSLSAKRGYMGFLIEGAPAVGAGGGPRLIVRTNVELEELRPPEFVDARDHPGQIWELLAGTDRNRRLRDVLRDDDTKPRLIEGGVRWVALVEPDSPALEFVHLYGDAVEAWPA